MGLSTSKHNIEDNKHITIHNKHITNSHYWSDKKTNI
jgi:hypothetical protein